MSSTWLCCIGRNLVKVWIPFKPAVTHDNTKFPRNKISLSLCLTKNKKPNFLLLKPGQTRNKQGERRYRFLSPESYTEWGTAEEGLKWSICLSLFIMRFNQKEKKEEICWAVQFCQAVSLSCILYTNVVSFKKGMDKFSSPASIMSPSFT